MKGNGTELISLYIPPNKRISDTRRYLTNELGTVDNIKSSVTRKNVSMAISSILSHLSNLEQSPDNGLVLFFGNVNDRFIKEVIIPPKPLSINIYKCDSSFFVDPLLSACEDHNKYGIVIVDLSECTIGTISGTYIDHIDTIESQIMNKHSKGGQSSVRFERLRDISINEFFKKIGDKVTQLWLNENIKGIIIAGPGITKDDFLNGSYMHHELMKKVIATVNTSYTDKYGLREAVDASQDILRDVEYITTKKVLDAFMGHLSKDSGLAEYGNIVYDHLSNGVVDTVILPDDIPLEILKNIEEVANEFSTKMLIVSSNSDEGKFISVIKIGCILRYKKC